MTNLKDALRQSFEAQVETQPQLVDPAARAMRRGRLMRSRRQAVVGSAMAVAVLAAGAAVVRGGMSGGDDPASAVTEDALSTADWNQAYQALPDGRPPRLDLLGNGQIVTERGSRVATPPGARAVRVPTGLLVWSVPGVLELVGDDGRRQEISRVRSEVVVSGDGRWAGWLESDLTLGAADLSRPGYVMTTTYDPVAYTPGTPPGTPWAWAGDWLLLSGNSDRGPTIGWWRPARATEPPDGATDLSLGTFGGTPLGLAPDGRHALVLLGAAGADGCLATMTLDREPRFDNKWCRPGLDAAVAKERGMLTPDGRWLVTPTGRDGKRGAHQLEILDVRAALAARDPYGRFPVPAWLRFTGAWMESRDVLVLDTGRRLGGRAAYVRCAAGAKSCERALAPVDGDFTLVPRHEV